MITPRYICLLFLGFLLIQQPVAFSQKKIKVSGKAELLVDDSQHIGQLKKQAEELAKLDALEKAFGKVIVQGIHTYLENTVSGDRVETYTKLNMIANTMVKGEWLETKSINTRWVLREIGEKKQKRQELWLLCDIVGHATELNETKVDLEAYTLKCTENTACVSTDFASNENIFLHIQSPINGYLSVFMEENGKIYRLFPYTRMEGDIANCMPIEADKAYTLFSSESAQMEGINKWEVDEYALYSEKTTLFNRIYVVFSETAFRKPTLTEKQGLKSLSIENFQKWTNKNKATIPSFQIKPIDIVVKSTQ